MAFSSPDFLKIITVIAPHETPPLLESYFGLLTDPIGRYGRAAYGNTTAFTLRGCSLFRKKSYNLFCTFSGNFGDREPILRNGDLPDSQFFCLPPYRVKTALRRYFYSKLYSCQAIVEPVFDDDREIIDSQCFNESELMYEAAKLAESFYFYEITPDHKTAAGWNTSTPVEECLTEYSLGERELDKEEEESYSSDYDPKNKLYLLASGTGTKYASKFI